MQTLNIPPLCHRPKSGPFKHVVLQSTSVCCFFFFLLKKMVFPSVSVSRPLWLLRQHHKEPGSSSQCATTKTFIPLDSWRRTQGIRARVCVFVRVRACEAEMVDQLEVKQGLPGRWKSCLLMSRLAEWMRTQMGFSLWWTFLLNWPLCVCERHGNLEPNGQASYWAVGWKT